jgi:hypothetical protein
MYKCSYYFLEIYSNLKLLNPSSVRRVSISGRRENEAPFGTDSAALAPPDICYGSSTVLSLFIESVFLSTPFTEPVKPVFSSFPGSSYSAPDVLQ